MPRPASVCSNARRSCSRWGGDAPKSTLQQIYAAYRQRFDLEHFFRFAKQHLLLDKFRTPEAQNEDHWWQFFWIAWQQRSGGTSDAVCIHGLLVLIAGPRVGLRPGRIEPRVRKRRPKKYPLMTQPRVAAREEVRLNGHPKK